MLNKRASATFIETTKNMAALNSADADVFLRLGELIKKRQNVE
jgi:hypothetical protein